MTVHEDIHVTVRCSAVLDRVNISVDQKLCSERNAAHCHCMSRIRPCAGSRRLTCSAVAFRAVAVSRNLECAKICLSGFGLLFFRSPGRFFRSPLCLFLCSLLCCRLLSCSLCRFCSRSLLGCPSGRFRFLSGSAGFSLCRRSFRCSLICRSLRCRLFFSLGSGLSCCLFSCSGFSLSLLQSFRSCFCLSLLFCLLLGKSSCFRFSALSLFSRGFLFRCLLFESLYLACLLIDLLLQCRSLKLLSADIRCISSDVSICLLSKSLKLSLLWPAQLQAPLPYSLRSQEILYNQQACSCHRSSSL